MQGLYAKLKSDVFKEQSFKVRVQDKAGKKIEREITGGVEDQSSETVS